MTPARKKLWVKDTTLRDGEQMEGVEYNHKDKVFLAKKIIEVGADACEVASAKVGNGEMKAVKEIAAWAEEAGVQRKIEVLSFIDDKSMEWVLESGVKTVNLLTKGAKNHCESQLGKCVEDHIADIDKYSSFLASRGIWVNVYLEAWSEGMRESKSNGHLELWKKRSQHKFLAENDYLFYMLNSLATLPVRELILCDTMGILDPFETYDFVAAVNSLLPEKDLVIHPHGDYELAVANCFAGVKAGAKKIQGTINGMGERAGNANLFSSATAIKDMLVMDHSLEEKRFSDLSDLVERLSGIRKQANMAVVGSKVYYDTAGVHADGKKKGLYTNPLSADRFADTKKKKKTSLGKLSGKASLGDALTDLGYELDKDSFGKVYQRFKELSSQGKALTDSDLPYIVRDALGRMDEVRMSVVDVISPFTLSQKKYSKVLIQYDNQIMSAEAIGDGQYDAFMNAMRKMFKAESIELPTLDDYIVYIPPGGKTSALTIVEITWKWKKGEEEKTMITKGTNSDQFTAAIEATEKMINLYLKMEYNGKEKAVKPAT